MPKVNWEMEEDATCPTYVCMSEEDMPVGFVKEFYPGKFTAYTGDTVRFGIIVGEYDNLDNARFAVLYTL